MASLAPHPDLAPDRRRGARAITLPRLVILESAVFVEEARLIDIGRLGFSVRTMVSHPDGAPLTITFREFPPFKAYAVWHSHGRLGARFEEPLADDIFAILTAKG
jgi:hypothetical protein